MWVVGALVWACEDGAGDTDPETDAALTDVAEDGPRPVDAAPEADPDGGPSDAGPDAAPDAAQGDAYVPRAPDEAPTEGPADLPGVADLSGRAPEGVARAGLVDAPEEALTGPEATCRPGCFRLDNAVAAFCVQGEGTFSQYTFQGGNLVDAVLLDRPGSDLFDQHFIAPAMGESTVGSIGVVRDGSEGGAAIVRVEGRAQGMRVLQGVAAGAFVPFDARVVTEYRLAPDVPHLDVLSWISADRVAGSVLLADVVRFGDRTTEVVLHDATGQVEMLAAYGPGAAYGWRSLDGPIDAFAIPDLLPFAAATYGQRFYRLGDADLIRRRFVVGTDIESLRGPPEGSVAVTLRGPDGARVRVRGAQEIDVTQGTLEAGSRTMRLAPGRYTAEVTGWPGGDVPAEAFEVVGDADLVLDLPVPARLQVRVEDADGRLVGAKLRFQGAGGRLDRAVAGEAVLEVPPGDWTLVTTRGWHFEVDTRALSLAPGAQEEVAVVLTELIPTPGWTSGEFHQHASPSIDSTVTVEDRVLDNLAEGVGFMAPSDHDVIHDYGAVISRMEVGDHVAAPLTGVEISPRVAHLGAYGIPYDADVGAGNAPPLPYFEAGSWFVHTVPELIADARRRGARLIQVNHPRGSTAFFETVGYDPAVSVAELDSPHWTTDFDAMEVFNERSLFCRVFQDWMGLLNQGVRITGVGNSDTHGPGEAGYPRNYLPTQAEHPTGVTADEVVEALQNGRVSVGGGAVLDLPDGPLFGDELRIEEGVWRVRVRVRTPRFARAHRLLAYHNGRQVLEVALEAEAEALVDHDGVLEIPVDADGHVVLVTVGDPNAPHGYSPVFAFGNPVWVDTDGDGVTSPGAIPVERPAFAFCQP